MIIKSPTAQDLPALRRLWQQAFGDPDSFVDRFFTKGFSAARCRCLWENKQPAAALYWFDCSYKAQKLAYIYGVATDTAFRRKGFCHQLMKDTLQHLSALGYAGAVLVPAGEALRAFYGKMGFYNFGGIREFTCVQGGQSVVLRKIAAKEYAALREDFLPAGSVLQEGAAMDFLSTYADFYAGDNILFSLYREEESAFIAEFLGDVSLVASVLQALNIPQGRFRVPGSDPFAMYYPLTDPFQIPAYFGHALD